jgi:hypothetical protein
MARGRASGIKTRTGLDRKRKEKTSNKDWASPRIRMRCGTREA